LYVKFWLHSPEGFTATIVVMTFLSGVNVFFLGVIGEYLGRVYEETKARPHYVIGKVVGRLSGVRSIRDAEAWERPTSLTGTD
jgi:glycosyltransferase involved in cell wall biosynthesis